MEVGLPLNTDCLKEPLLDAFRLTALYCNSLYHHKELIKSFKNHFFVCELVANSKFSPYLHENNRIHYVSKFVTYCLTKLMCLHQGDLCAYSVSYLLRNH